ncbi:MAG: hypothetical protein ACHREM_18520 [Polyangiales bacterium]
MNAWLFGRRVDLGVFVGAPLVAIVIALIASVAGVHEPPSWALLALVICVDVAHVHGTLFRVYLDGAEVRRRPWLYVGAPFALYAFGACLYATFGAHGFWRLLAYVAVFHFIRQQVGWVALYRSKEPTATPFDARLDALAIYAATVGPLAWWHAHLPRAFVWFVEGDFVAGLSDPIARAVLGFEAIVLSLFFLRQIMRLRRDEALVAGRSIVVATTAVAWFAGIVVAQDDLAFTALNVIPHGVPYLALTWCYARHRYGDDRAAAPLARAIVARGALAIVASLVAIALVEETLWDRLVWHDHPRFFGEGALLSPRALTFVVPLLALPQATHYLLDGFVWRRRDNPTLAGLFSSAAVTQRALERTRASN